jgi:hypothetical protein
MFRPERSILDGILGIESTKDGFKRQREIIQTILQLNAEEVYKENKEWCSMNPNEYRPAYQSKKKATKKKVEDNADSSMVSSRPSQEASESNGNYRGLAVQEMHAPSPTFPALTPGSQKAGLKRKIISPTRKPAGMKMLVQETKKLHLQTQGARGKHAAGLGGNAEIRHNKNKTGKRGKGKGKKKGSIHDDDDEDDDDDDEEEDVEDGEILDTEMNGNPQQAVVPTKIGDVNMQDAAELSPKLADAQPQAPWTNEKRDRPRPLPPREDTSPTHVAVHLESRFNAVGGLQQKINNKDNKNVGDPPPSHLAQKEGRRPPPEEEVTVFTSIYQEHLTRLQQKIHDTNRSRTPGKNYRDGLEEGKQALEDLFHKFRMIIMQPWVVDAA